MKAAVIDAPRQMHVGEWSTPEPAAGEVRVAVEAAGICAGDMYIYLGKNPYAKYPQIGGHEICGVVESLGPGVPADGCPVGTRVVVEPFLNCGHCYPCRVGKPNCCTRLRIIGTTLPGGFAQFVCAPADRLHPVPAELSPVLASFAEPLAIGIHGCRRAQVAAGEEVLILGCGPIGLALVEVVLARGAIPVATDVAADRREFARSLGAEVLEAGDGLRERVLERTRGEGMPVVVEATGNPQVMESAVDLVAAGGRVVILGLVKEGTGITLPGLDFTRKELTIVGSRASTGCFPEALALLAGGRLRYPRSATEFCLQDSPDVFARLAAGPGTTHKGVLLPER